MTDRTEELRETAAQCVALAQSTTDPAVRAALTIMAQKLCDVANHRSAAYDVAEREFNDRQVLQQFPVQQPRSTMQQQRQIQSMKEKKRPPRLEISSASAGFSFSPANLSQVPGVSTVRDFPMRGAEPC